MGVSRLLDMLKDEDYGPCRVEAEAMLHAGDLTPGDKAAVFHALSRSLCGLGFNQEALGPGELAVHFARETEQWDLLGRAICNLAFIYGLNRLYYAAVVRMEEYFDYLSRYDRSGSLVGWVYYNQAVFYREWGQMQRALECYEKAYQWSLAYETDPERTEKCRANLAWHCLRMGLCDRVSPLLSLSDRYLKERPDDRDAITRHWNNLAYQAYLQGDYERTVDIALATVRAAADLPVRRAYACLILHHTARALGMPKQAAGLAVLVRIQAFAARRPDIDEEVCRSVMQVQQQAGISLVEDLFRDLGQSVRRTGKVPLGPAI